MRTPSGRWHWGTRIAIVYTAFAVSTVGFVVFAMHRPVDLVHPDYYARSLQHDAHLAAIGRTGALGDAFSIAQAGSGRSVIIRWPRDMAPAVAGSATFYRADNAHADRVVALAPDAEARQEIMVDSALRGLWTVQVEWSAGGESYYAERRLMLR